MTRAAICREHYREIRRESALTLDLVTYVGSPLSIHAECSACVAWSTENEADPFAPMFGFPPLITQVEIPHTECREMNLTCRCGCAIPKITEKEREALQEALAEKGADGGHFETHQWTPDVEELRQEYRRRNGIDQGPSHDPS